MFIGLVVAVDNSVGAKEFGGLGSAVCYPHQAQGLNASPDGRIVGRSLFCSRKQAVNQALVRGFHCFGGVLLSGKSGRHFFRPQTIPNASQVSAVINGHFLSLHDRLQPSGSHALAQEVLASEVVGGFVGSVALFDGGH